MFFNGFTFDTLLGCISCLLGIIGIFLGAKAYSKCKLVKSSLNDNKEFKDSSSDHSQRATGNIINNSCDVEALTKLTASNFEASLKQAYSMFEQQASTNLYQIIEQTQRIIQEQKPNIAGLSKIDWINIYFENAKNTSDEYMQGVWAKLLAKELEKTGSFSYLTLDALKNMTSEDFHIFEILCSFQVEGAILQEDIYTKYGLRYIDLVKISEYGLLNMGLSKKIYKIPSQEDVNIVYNKLMIKLSNSSEQEVKLTISVYLLSSIAEELLQIINTTSNEDYARDFVKALRKVNDHVDITLHRINFITDKEINYQLEDIC